MTLRVTSGALRRPPIVDAPRSLTLTYDARSEAEARAKAAVDEARLAADGLSPVQSTWAPGGTNAANVALFGVLGLAMKGNGRLTVVFAPPSDGSAPRVTPTMRCARCARQYAAVMDRCPYCGLSSPEVTT